MAPTPSPGPQSPYKIILQPPPGSIIAPNGFPTPPIPTDPTVPVHFLDAMKVRIPVFCIEQHCSPSEELDSDDPRSWHWILYDSSSSADTTEKKKTTTTTAGTPLSVIRIVPPPHEPHPNGFVDPDEEPYVKLGRVATMLEARGKGLSRMLIEEAMRWTGEHAKEVGGEEWKGLVLTHAQVQVEGLYRRLGFVTDARLGRWMEERIEHVGMWRRIGYGKVADEES